MNQNGSRLGRPSKLAALAPLRFGLTNALMVLFFMALIKGGPFVGLVLILTLLIGAVGDKLQSDDRYLATGQPHWLYAANLYATLPLIIVTTVTYVHYLTPADPIGLISFLSSSGISFAASPALSRTGLLIAATLGIGVFYGFANTVAHELYHRSSNPVARMISRLLLAFTFETSAPFYHLHWHHRDAGTFEDASTARRHETVYAFAQRLIVNSLRAAFNSEAKRLRRRGISAWSWKNRSLRGELWSIAILVAVASIAGSRGVAGFVTAAAIGKMLFVTMSYTTHYGLVRVEGTRFAARHAWDCYGLFSNALLYNLSHHSDHHQHASKPFYQLDPASTAPTLPYGYQTMALISFIPALWNRVMDPLLADWDRRFASEAERRLVHERGWAIAPAEHILA